MDMLKLVALDEEDLGVISAHVQDAVMRSSISTMQGVRPVHPTMNRFAWDAGAGGARPATSGGSAC